MELKNINAEELKQAKVSAENIAHTIFKTFSSNFFTYADMRKEMWTYSNPAHKSMATKMTWGEAKSYIAAIRKHGMVEDHTSQPDCFKVRLDSLHRKEYFERQKAKYVEEISNINYTLQLIAKDEKASELPKEKKKGPAKKAAPKKAVKKKAAAPGKLKVVKK